MTQKHSNDLETIQNDEETLQNNPKWPETTLKTCALISHLNQPPWIFGQRNMAISSTLAFVHTSGTHSFKVRQLITSIASTCTLVEAGCWAWDIKSNNTDRGCGKLLDPAWDGWILVELKKFNYGNFPWIDKYFSIFDSESLTHKPSQGSPLLWSCRSSKSDDR